MPNKKKPNKKVPKPKKRVLTQEETQQIKTSELSSVKTPREIKRQTAATKRRIAEAKEEIKVNKKVTKQIASRSTVNPDLLTLSVINKGAKNRYPSAEKRYIRENLKLERLRIKLKNNTGANKDALIAERVASVKKAKSEMMAQKLIAKNEAKQIRKLNRHPKGELHGVNDEDDIITVKKVNKYYATGTNIFQALSRASVSIKKGTFNVILGPSGSGKTTLLNMISGLDRPTSGEIIVNGVNITALTDSYLTQFRRNQIGFVFQSYNLLSSLNVSDNIEVGRSLQTNKSKRRKIPQLLEAIDMAPNAKKKTYELSGGQQQRVSIARALAKTPNILIGDEPTGALDQKTSLKVFELFQEINKKDNATVIIVTHNVNVAKLADQVIHVQDGKIDHVVQNSNPLQAKDLKTI